MLLGAGFHLDRLEQLGRVLAAVGAVEDLPPPADLETLEAEAGGGASVQRPHVQRPGLVALAGEHDGLGPPLEHEFLDLAAAGDELALELAPVVAEHDDDEPRVAAGAGADVESGDPRPAVAGLPHAVVCLDGGAVEHVPAAAGDGRQRAAADQGADVDLGAAKGARGLGGGPGRGPHDGRDVELAAGGAAAGDRVDQEGPPRPAR